MTPAERRRGPNATMRTDLARATRAIAIGGLVAWGIGWTDIGSLWVFVPSVGLVGTVIVKGLLRLVRPTRPTVDVASSRPPGGSTPSVLAVLVVRAGDRHWRTALGAARRVGVDRLVVIDRTGRGDLAATAPQLGVPVLTSTDGDGEVVRQLVQATTEDVALLLRADVVVVPERVRAAIGRLEGVDALIGTIELLDDRESPTMDYGAGGGPGDRPSWMDAASVLLVRRHVFTVANHRRLPASCWWGTGLVREAERLGGVIARPCEPLALRVAAASESTDLSHRLALASSAVADARRIGLADLRRSGDAAAVWADALDVVTAPLRVAALLLPLMASLGATPLRTVVRAPVVVGAVLVVLWCVGCALDGRGWTWWMRRGLRVVAADLVVLGGRRARPRQLLILQRGVGMAALAVGVAAVVVPLLEGSDRPGHLSAALGALGGCVVAFLGRDLWWAAVDHQRRRSPRIRGQETGSGAVIDLSRESVRLRGDGVALGARFEVALAVGPAGERRRFIAQAIRIDPPAPAEPVGSVVCSLEGSDHALDDLALFVTVAASGHDDDGVGGLRWQPDPLLNFVKADGG